MKQVAFILYTVFCIALGSLFFRDSSNAAGNLNTPYYSVYELGTPPGYRACLGVSFRDGVNRNDVIVDWKSNANFVIYIKK